jgi:LAS superfamily LD-carboxypeptidase LdcB
MSYEEKRVLVRNYGTLASSSPLLVPIPTSPGHPQQKLHKLAAEGLRKLTAAASSGVHVVLLGASGWRPHRWTSREQYEDVLVQKYGSVEKGRRYLAFDSPHETGLALDLGCGGLEPRSATIEKQQATPLWKWLVENAWRCGWHPYEAEPWHWEFPVSLAAYRSGVADSGPQVCSADDGSCVETLDED